MITQDILDKSKNNIFTRIHCNLFLVGLKLKFLKEYKNHENANLILSRLFCDNSLKSIEYNNELKGLIFIISNSLFFVKTSKHEYNMTNATYTYCMQTGETKLSVGVSMRNVLTKFL